MYRRSHSMLQKYGSDPIRNLLVDRVESSAMVYQRALEELKAHDYKEETNDLIDIE